MATEIIMPKLSDTMTEGQLGAWRKSVGERNFIALVRNLGSEASGK